MKTISNKKKQEQIQQYQKEYQKKYRKENADKIREYQREYYSKNPDKYKSYRKKYKEQSIVSQVKRLNHTKIQSKKTVRKSDAYLEWKAREREAESIRKANARWLAQSVDINNRKI
jgi:hypothetical protein